MSSELVITNVV